LDADGVRASADNCDTVANSDQADLDGDGQGDACDSDQDGDGLSDAVEAQLRTNPRATDTDGDGRPDGADSCPTLAAATANGCPDPPLPALDFTIRGFPRRIALRTLRTRGVSLTVEPNRAAAFVVELRGRLRGARIARVRDFVVAERRLRSAAGRRRVRLVVPRSERRRLRRGSRLTLRVIATDAAGQSQIATRRLTVRRASRRQSRASRSF
jgi:Thrombospondin type 3 repeat